MSTELILDLNLGAFTLFHTTPSASKHPVFLRGYIQSSRKEGMTDYSVVKTRRMYENRFEHFKYLSVHNGDLVISEYNDITFKDWKALDTTEVGYSFNSFLVTSPISLGNFALNKQANYLSCFFIRTEVYQEDNVLYWPSSCLTTALWDWHTRPDEYSKWSREFNTYYYPHKKDLFVYDSVTDTLVSKPEELVITKNKLRGRGRSLMLRFRSDEDKDMRLAGFHLPFIQEERV